MSRRPDPSALGPLPAGARSLGVAIGGPAPSGKSKYRAKPTEYRGERYASKAEAAYAAELDLEVAAGGVAWWIRQVRFPLGDDALRVDFLVCRVEGAPGRHRREMVAVEIKGYATRDYARKAKLWRKYGPIPLWVVRKGGIEVVERAGGGLGIGMAGEGPG
jgi:hypothetical protein